MTWTSGAGTALPRQRLPSGTPSAQRHRAGPAGEPRASRRHSHGPAAGHAAGHGGSAVAVAVLALAAAASLGLTTPTSALDTHFEYELNPQHNFGKRLDVQGGDTAPGAHVIQFDCHRGDNQRFRFENIFGSYYEIRAVHSGLCLDIRRHSLANGAHLIQFPCNGGSHQLFQVLEDTTAPILTSRIAAVHSAKCLDVAGASDANSAHVIQFPCYDDHPNQRFDILRAD